MNTDPHDIFRAAAEGDLEAIRCYLAAGHSVNVCNLARDMFYGMAPLHIAAKGGFTEGVRLLLQAGADPDVREGRTQETPLFHAARAQSTACVRLLLDAGADVNARCVLSSTPLDETNENDWYPGSALYKLLRSGGAKHAEELPATSPGPPTPAQDGIRQREILKSLVRFCTDDEHPQETAECLDYVQRMLEEHGVELIQRLGCEPKQQLVAALNTPEMEDIEGGLMLCGHLDVVPGDEEQFYLRSEAGRLYGRGVADMKGSIACFLHLLPMLMQQPFPIILAFTTDEESDMKGIGQICSFLQKKRIRPALTILGEPTGGQIGTASSGLYGLCTDIWGKAAHSSRPQDGINALYIAARLLSKLETLGLEAAPRGVYVNAGQLTGGGNPSTVPDYATLRWGLRSFEHERVKEFLESFLRAEKQVKLQYPGCEITTECSCRFPAFCAGEEAAALANELSGSLGYPVASIPYTTEAGYLQEAGLRVLLLGAGHPREAHREDESVRMEELADYEKALQAVCRMLVLENSR